MMSMFLIIEGYQKYCLKISSPEIPLKMFIDQ